ncbi:MAG TPA: hypothetical protein VLA64_00170 [Azonexus sp.]|nr:hypothetical protein [Azonexus sp.]
MNRRTNFREKWCGAAFFPKAESVTSGKALHYRTWGKNNGRALGLIGECVFLAILPNADFSQYGFEGRQVERSSAAMMQTTTIQAAAEVPAMSPVRRDAPTRLPLFAFQETQYWKQ